ncbi:hypothetical protein BS17DRAFT_792943 [Gyrodon lividus]|nr:hypothetical protein BS17DRAFT_792943 [Gyrodon lividus]
MSAEKAGLAGIPEGGWSDLDTPRDAAIYACIVTVLYCVARLGEFTVPAISKFDQAIHITRSNLTHLRDPSGLPCSATGEDTQCAPLPGCITDPQAALENHFRINQAPPDAHLFAWKHPKGGLRPLSKTESVMGRWAGNSFTLYLHNHALILAPFLQVNDEAMSSFDRYTMPPVR